MDQLFDWLRERTGLEWEWVVAGGGYALAALRWAGPAWRLLARGVGRAVEVLTPRPSEALRAILEAINDSRTRLVDGRLCHPKLVVEFPNASLGSWALVTVHKVTRTAQGEQREGCDPHLSESERHAVNHAALRRRDTLQADARDLARWALIEHLKDAPLPGGGGDGCRPKGGSL